MKIRISESLAERASESMRVADAVDMTENALMRHCLSGLIVDAYENVEYVEIYVIVRGQMRFDVWHV